jgi:ABC-2 type transport system permease protein
VSTLAPGALAPRPGAAPRRRIIATQTTAEVLTALRNGEQLLLTLVIPVLVLVGLSRAPAELVGGSPVIDVVTPGVLGLAVLSTAFTGQAIGTGFERRYGVLRLLGATPLGRSGLLVSKTLGVLLVETVQVALLTAVALGLGWAPAASWPLAIPVLVLGTATFSALGLLLAGVLRAEATLAVANGLYLLLLAGGGLVLPADRLPDPLAAVVALLPTAALGDALRAVLLTGTGVPVTAVGVLVAWGAAAAYLTVRTFRWS